MIYLIVKTPFTTYLLLLQIEKVVFCERDPSKRQENSLKNI